MSVELVYCLRTCKPDGSSHGGFVWPKKGPVECPDWNGDPVCGGGLHGFLRGEGDGSLNNWAWDALWLVFAARADEVVDLRGKVKVPRAWVVFAGSRRDATGWLRGRYPDAAIIGGTVTAGEKGTAVAGDRGDAKAGDFGVATAGDWGDVVAGEGGTARVGYRGIAKAGHSGTAQSGAGGRAVAGNRGTATAGTLGKTTAGARGTATAGDCGEATAGHHGVATVGIHGIATVGHDGTAIADNYGVAVAGDRGVAVAGRWGKAKAGVGGVIMIRWFDRAQEQEKVMVGLVGQDCEADKLYRVTCSGRLVEVSEGGGEP